MAPTAAGAGQPVAPTATAAGKGKGDKGTAAGGKAGDEGTAAARGKGGEGRKGKTPIQNSTSRTNTNEGFLQLPPDNTRSASPTLMQFTPTPVMRQFTCMRGAPTTTDEIYRQWVPPCGRQEMPTIRGCRMTIYHLRSPRKNTTVKTAHQRLALLRYGARKS